MSDEIERSTPAAASAGTESPETTAPDVVRAADGGRVGTEAATTGTAEAPAQATEPAAFPPDQARLVLRRVKDPELNLNIVDLGLIYDIHVVGRDVRVDMSLTSPGCPSGPEIMGEAEKELRTIPGVGEVVVNLVWTPAWTPERIEPRVRAYMGF